MDLNSRLPYPKIIATYLDHILLQLAVDNFPLTLNMGGYFNLLK